MTPTLLTPADARARLHVGRNALYDLIKRREISVVMMGRKILVPESEIDRLIARATVPAKRAFFNRHRSNPSAPRVTI